MNHGNPMTSQTKQTFVKVPNPTSIPNFSIVLVYEYRKPFLSIVKKKWIVIRSQLCQDMAFFWEINSFLYIRYIQLLILSLNHSVVLWYKTISICHSRTLGPYQIDGWNALGKLLAWLQQNFWLLKRHWGNNSTRKYPKNFGLHLRCYLCTWKVRKWVYYFL